MLNKLKDLLKDPKQEQDTNKPTKVQTSEEFITYMDKEGKQYVKTFLSVTDEESILETKREILMDDLNSLPPLPFGEVTIDKIYIYLDNDEIEVSSFIRNGTESPISFNAVSLGIMDKDEKIVAQQSFALVEAGIVPPGGARPYTFKFSSENVHSKEFNQDECQIVFQPETGQTSTQTVNKIKLLNPPPWFSEEQLVNLENYIAQLPIVLEGEFNIAGIEAMFNQEAGLNVLVLFRNGSKDTVNLSKMPLALIDIEGNEIATGLFDLSHLTIEGYSAILVNLTFDKTGFTFEGEPDLSAWAVILMDIDNDGLAS